MWALRGSERIITWRKFRNSIASLELLTQLEKVVEFWAKAPLASARYDWSQPNSWPSPWELMLDEDYDEFSIGLGMAYTLFLTPGFDYKIINIQAFNDRDNSSYYFPVVVDKYLLNYSYNQIVNLNIISRSAILLQNVGYIDLRITELLK